MSTSDRCNKQWRKEERTVGMGMRVYLKLGPHIVGDTAFGLHCVDSKTTPFIDVGSEPPFAIDLSQEILAVVKKFSWKGMLPGFSRHTGEYRWGTAQAVVRFVHGYKYQHLELYIEGRRQEDVSQLYNYVSGGLVQPTIPYDKPAMPLARNARQLLQELVKVICRDLEIWWKRKIR